MVVGAVAVGLAFPPLPGSPALPGGGMCCLGTTGSSANFPHQTRGPFSPSGHSPGVKTDPSPCSCLSPPATLRLEPSKVSLVSLEQEPFMQVVASNFPSLPFMYLPLSLIALGSVPLWAQSP